MSHSTIVYDGDIALVAIHNGDWSGDVELRVVNELLPIGTEGRVLSELTVDGALLLKLVGRIAQQVIEKHLDDFNVENALSK